MSQARVTDFFATRKRNRLDQNEVLLNKQKKTQMLIDSPEALIGVQRALRSRTKQQPLETAEEKPQTPGDEEQPKKGRGRNAAKKEQLEALKARITRLDDKMSKVVTPPVAAPEQPVAQETVAEKPQEEVKPAGKKRLNKAELKQKIEQFNKNLLLIQNQTDETSESSKPTEPEPVSKPVEPEIPAYLKYKDLASDDIDPTVTLTLPKSYAQLLDFFKGSDTIIKFLFNRDEMCTFLKLRMGIQNITKHTFMLKHLAQIKTVYAQAYLYKQEKLFIDFKNDYHLIISPNLDEIDTNPENGLKQFTPGVLLKRLTKFKANLFNIVKKYHQEFLESMGITGIPFDKIKRWHQKFDLENLKEVDESELPKPPNDDSVKCKTGQELLTIAKDIYSARIQDAIKKSIPKEDTVQLEIINKTSELKVHSDSKNQLTITNSTTQVKSSDGVVLSTTTSTVTLDSVVVTEKPATDKEILDKLKEKKESTYNALLEKIRNKEKQKNLEKMILNNDDEKTLGKYRTFKEAIRFLAFFFQAEKKSTLELDTVSKKMCENLKSFSEMQCKEMLCEMAGKDSCECILMENDKKWLNVINVRKLQYLQMDKSFKLNDLLTMCDKAIEKIQNKS